MEELRAFFTDRKNIINLLILGIMLVGLPIGTQLLRNQMLLRSFAAGEPVQFSVDQTNVFSRNGTLYARKPDIALILTSSLGPKTQSAYAQPQIVTKAYADEWCPDDVYYWDPNVNSCIHKHGGVYSPSGVGECTYAFDQTDPRRCGRNAEPADPVSSNPPPAAPAQVCTPNEYSDRDCNGATSGCVYRVRQCKGDGSGWGDWFTEGPNCDFAPSGCNKMQQPQSGGQPGTGGQQQPPTSGSACYVNGGWTDPTSANNGCTNHYGAGSSCSKDVSSGTYADGCTIPDSAKKDPCAVRSLQACADSAGKPAGAYWCTSPECKTSEAGCYKNQYTQAGEDKVSSCPANTPPAPGDSACWTDGGYASQKSADDGCTTKYGGGTTKYTCSKTVGSNSKPDGCTPAGSIPPSGTPSISPSASPTPVITGTTHFRVANDPVSLRSASWQSYNSHPMTISWKLDTSTPRGSRTVWVEFKDAQNNTRQESATIILIGEAPTVTGTSCEVDLNTSNLSFKVSGKNFDNTGGDLTTPTAGLKVLSWKDNQVVAIMENPGKVNRGQPFSLTLTRKDGEAAQTTCSVGTSQLSLGAKIFCRAPSAQSQPGIELTIVPVETASVGTPKKVKQTVSIDPSGMIQGLQTVLEEGKAYKLSIKAPKSLRKTITFIASAGTSVIPNFNLPVGDIFPAGGDDVINNMDYSELKREWTLVGGSAGSRPGDFNLDAFINSFDFACMKYDFGKGSDAEL